MNTEEFHEREKKSLPYADPELRSSYLKMKEYYCKQLLPLFGPSIKDTTVEVILNAAKDFMMETSEMAVMTFELCELYAKNPETGDLKNDDKGILYEKLDRKMNDAATKHGRLCASFSALCQITKHEYEKKILRTNFKFLTDLQNVSLATLFYAVKTIGEYSERETET